MDLGTKALKEDFSDNDQDTLVKKVIVHLTNQINITFERIVINGFNTICNPDGELKGKWQKGPMYTVTHQSTLLGVPAMQIEIPRSIR